MPNSKSPEINSELARVRRIINFTDGTNPNRSVSVKSDAFMSEKAKQVLGSRTPEEIQKSWIPMKDRGLDLTDGKIVNPEKAINQHARSQDYIGSYYNWNGPLRPEYDMMEPMAINDTEAYVKQTINRRLALMFRNGYEVVGRDRDVAYINERIATMEYVSNRSFRAFMKQLMFCLFLQGNCFLLKIRKAGASGVPQKDGAPIPVSSYAIIPSHQIQPYMKAGVIWKWRRYYDTGKFFDEYDPKEIIHLKLDKKPWHIFGTPRTVAVREDIFALRRLEENTELLFINYLFPLFHVKVGTELNPATYIDTGESELDLVKYQIENMPKEGVFVTDERTAVEVVGANGQVLDFMSLLTYYKARVFAGLGISEMDMGSPTHGGSAVSDNISQNLKDSIKADVEEFADQIKMHIFKEWFQEANYSLSVQAALEEIELTFHEIDLDNKIKEESHIVNLFTQNLLTFEEARKRMRLKPTVDQKDLYINRNTAWLAKVQSDVDTNNAIRLAKATGDVGTSGPTTKVTKKHANSKTGVSKTHTVEKTASAPMAKAVNNIVLPINQHGQKTSGQKVGHDAFIELLKQNLIPACEALSSFEDSDWKTCSSDLIDSTFADFTSLQVDDSEENSYTKHLQDDLGKLKEIIASINDPEELALVLEYSDSLEDTLIEISELDNKELDENF